jgi:IS30 family transposase
MPPRKRRPPLRQPDHGKTVQPWARAHYSNAAFAEEQRRCWELRLRGLSIRQIAAQTGLTKSTVERRLQGEFEEYRQESAQLREQYIQLELERLDAAQVVVLSILEANHVLVSDGRIVTVTVEGEKIPLPDSSPVLAAIREYRMLSESRRKLLGLDAPTKSTVVHAEADVDAAVMELAAEMSRRPDRVAE